ncbi:MAG: PaaI family thioesterase [Actinomycetota bacterium]|nr:PaaI family thioesterase [Actinomycetota bacterium]
MPDIPYFPSDRNELGRTLEALGADRLPGILGIELLELGDGTSAMRCVIEERHLASNGYLHAASVVALADTTAGYGCIANLPDGALGFTTLELKTNHLATLLTGAMVSAGKMSHSGRATQVWDVTVSAEDTGKTLALFRCTQFILYPHG